MPAQLRQRSLPFYPIKNHVIRRHYGKKHKYAFCGDFLYRARKSVPDIEVDEHILNAALVDSDKRLQNQGISLECQYPFTPKVHTRRLLSFREN